MGLMCWAIFLTGYNRTNR